MRLGAAAAWRRARRFARRAARRAVPRQRGDDVGPIGARLPDVDLEAGGGEAAGEEAHERFLARRPRHQPGVGRVDGDEVAEQVGQVVVYRSHRGQLSYGGRAGRAYANVSTPVVRGREGTKGAFMTGITTPRSTAARYAAGVPACRRRRGASCCRLAAAARAVPAASAQPAHRRHAATRRHPGRHLPGRTADARPGDRLRGQRLGHRARHLRQPAQLHERPGRGRHQDRRRHGDRGADRRQRRHHERRQDLHLPHPAGHQVRAAGQPRGHGAGLRLQLPAHDEPADARRRRATTRASSACRPSSTARPRPSPATRRPASTRSRSTSRSRSPRS